MEGRPGWTDNPGAKPCRDYWWTSLLYINTLVGKPADMCVGVSWYLSNDMMYYIIAPLVMIPWVYGFKIIGFAMSGILLAVHIGTSAWLVAENNFDLLRK